MNIWPNFTLQMAQDGFGGEAANTLLSGGEGNRSALGWKHPTNPAAGTWFLLELGKEW